MAENSAIEWTDCTFNPWVGCAKVSKGCANCYAETDFDKRRGFAKWGPNGTRVVKAESGWREPLKWNREAQAAGVRKRVFCASLADVFEQWAGWMTDAQGHRMFIEDFRGPWRGDVDSPLTMDTVRARLFALIRDTPHLDWLLLTKRPEAINDNVTRLELSWLKDLPSNVWIGTSVEDQHAADTRIPHLLNVKATVRFLSMEPLLGAVDLSKWLSPDPREEASRRIMKGSGWRPDLTTQNDIEIWLASRLHWAIVGGESGPGSRRMMLEWTKDIVGQCQRSNVPVFIKQLGAAPAYDGSPMGTVVPIALKLRDRKGGDLGEWPTALRVRELPKVIA